MPKKIDPALKKRAVRLVLEHRKEYPTTTAAVVAVAKQVGVRKESLRRWVSRMIGRDDAVTVWIEELRVAVSDEGIESNDTDRR